MNDRNLGDAENYRLLQAAALIKLFSQRVGRAARDSEEGTLRLPIDPREILTNEEIQAAISHHRC